MLNLPIPEMILFVLAAVLYLAAGLIGTFQIIAKKDQQRSLITHLISIAVTLEAVLLAFRAASLKALPLTGPFESMIVLTAAFGLTYLIIGIFIQQIWFAAVMSWMITLMIVLAALVAEPASEPNEYASTPFAIAHGIAMILGEVMVLVAAVAAWIYLVAHRRLKQKKITKVIGIVPNIQKLKRLNQFGLNAGFIFITLGLVSGLGMAYLGKGKPGTTMAEWLTDPRIVSFIIGWGIITFILLSQHFNWIKSRWRARLSILVLVFILFALIAQFTNLIPTKHDFTESASEVSTAGKGGSEL